MERGIEFQIDGTENSKLSVIVEPLLRAQNSVPLPIRWTFCRPPAYGAMANLSDSQKPVEAAFHIIVPERT